MCLLKGMSFLETFVNDVEEFPAKLALTREFQGGLYHVKW